MELLRPPDLSMRRNAEFREFAKIPCIASVTEPQPFWDHESHRGLGSR